jgi:hypothetical protein
MGDAARTGLPCRTESAMKYALLLYAEPGADDHPVLGGAGAYDSWGDYSRALRDAGALLGAQRLHDTGTATTVRRSGGELLLTDGPFAETKEHLLGFYLLDVADLDAALDWAARMPLIRYGSIEVRPVQEEIACKAVLD